MKLRTYIRAALCSQLLSRLNDGFCLEKKRHFELALQRKPFLTKSIRLEGGSPVIHKAEPIHSAYSRVHDLMCKRITLQFANSTVLEAHSFDPKMLTSCGKNTQNSDHRCLAKSRVADNEGYKLPPELHSVNMARKMKLPLHGLSFDIFSSP